MGEKLPYRSALRGSHRGMHGRREVSNWKGMFPTFLGGICGRRETCVKGKRVIRAVICGKHACEITAIFRMTRGYISK